MTPDQLSTLIDALRGAVNQATVNVKCSTMEGYGKVIEPIRRKMSLEEFREIYLREKDRPVELIARVSVPDKAIAPLIEILRSTLREFIDPSDKIGHAFPVDSEIYVTSSILENGLFGQESVSRLGTFSRTLVRVAAVVGVKETAELLATWKKGRSINLKLRTVLSGLPLTASVSLQQGIQIDPLPLSTEDLPRLPVRSDISARKYLGLSVVSIHASANPVFFCPDIDREDPNVHFRTHENVDFNLLCEALSLQANDHVSMGFCWCEYKDAALFNLTKKDTWNLVDENQLQLRKCKKEYRDAQDGHYTITPSDDAQPLSLDKEKLSFIIERLQNHADEKLRIAISRWRRSKRPTSSLEDSYIDLRIALEALYLDRFNENYSHEMRFRLALFGASHLTENPEDRRSIHKLLLDTYSIASRIIHGDKALKRPSAEKYAELRVKLTQAQDLCREGILKFIHEDSQKDWYDLVFGSPVQPAPLLDIPVEDGTPASHQNPQLVSISVEGFSHDRKKIGLKLEFQGIQDKSVLISSSAAHELSKVLRGGG